MTDIQIGNWRKILCGILGPYALLMPREEIVILRDKLQQRVNAIPNMEAQNDPQH